MNYVLYKFHDNKQINILRCVAGFVQNYLQKWVAGVAQTV